jgi:hypothetical protein
MFGSQTPEQFQALRAEPPTYPLQIIYTSYPRPWGLNLTVPIAVSNDQTNQSFDCR